MCIKHFTGFTIIQSQIIKEVQCDNISLLVLTKTSFIFILTAVLKMKENKTGIIPLLVLLLN